jgi:hypothetical protein
MQLLQKIVPQQDAFDEIRSGTQHGRKRVIPCGVDKNFSGSWPARCSPRIAMNRRILCAAIVGGAILVTGLVVTKGGKRSVFSKAKTAPAVAFRVNGNGAEAMGVIDLESAISQGSIKAEFFGNGRDTLRGSVTNQTARALQVRTDAGQVFEAGKDAVVVVRPCAIELAPRQTSEMALQTCAVTSTNRIGEIAYTISTAKTPKLQPLLTYATEHLELSPGAIQTAALALTENLPLSAVSRFTPAAGELKSRFNTDAFRVETIDILAALTALRAMGIPDSSLAMTIDPQLKIEAMIEPLCHAAAMQYYGITEENEWEYWKGELLAGAPATRHYALYGIARFYPEIALEMLPRWAREPQTRGVYRIAALQALADTQRVEALPLLRQLADELGIDTEVGRAARGAAEYLDQRLNQIGVRQTAVAFRASRQLSQF